MLDFIHSRLIPIQYSVVILLIIISFQAVRALKMRQFYLIACGWLANFLYLLATEASPQLFGLATKVLPTYLGTIADIFDFLANASFWYVAYQYGRQPHRVYLRHLDRLRLFLLMGVSYASYIVLGHLLPQDHYGYFVISALPQILFDMLALRALAHYFEEIVSSIRDIQPPRLRLLYRATLAYSWIQPLQLLAHDTVKKHLGGIDVADLGFAFGFLAKSGILLGIIGLFVRSAEAVTTTIAEQERIQALTKAIDRLAHELGTPISETLTHVMALKAIDPRDVAIRLRRLEGAASRAAAILGASRFGVNPATLTLASRRSDGTWIDEQLTKPQVSNLNTLLEIAENAVKDTRSEKADFHHQYSGRCCLECVPSEIIQIFINILRNAYDAFPEKTGRIDIITLNESSSEEEKTRWPRGKVKAIITDNGHGISDEIKEKMFTEGYSTRSGTGRGFGLAVVKKLTEQHNGVVEIFSPPSHNLTRSAHTRGTEVVLAFPRVPCTPR